MENDSVEIEFLYEHVSDGHTETKTVSVPRESFEQNQLLFLVCAYMESRNGYPGPDIDAYLHYRFCNIHTFDYAMVFGHSAHRICGCRVEGLRSFGELVENILGLNTVHAERYMEDRIADFMKAYRKGFLYYPFYPNEYDNRKEGFSIWKE